MTAASQQIVSAYEIGMTPEQIAEDNGIDITIVKATLRQYCPVFRKDAKTDDRLNFTVDEQEEMKEIILNIARYEEEDQQLKFKAAKYIRDDGRGRLDINKEVQGLNINVIQIAKRFDEVRAARERTLAIKSIDAKKEVIETAV